MTLGNYETRALGTKKRALVAECSLLRLIAEQLVRCVFDGVGCVIGSVFDGVSCFFSFALWLAASGEADATEHEKSECE